MTETEKECTKEAKKVLVGRKIVGVRYLDDEEMEHMGWYKRPIMFQLDNGTLCFVSCDDEGNDGGALFYGENGVIPTI